MTVLEKLEYLVKSYGLTEHKFLQKYHAHYGLMKRIRGGYVPEAKDVKKLCKILDFDVNDFLDDSSSVNHVLKEGEHFVKKATPQVIPQDAVLEDYPHEDNSRYEEKD